MAFESVTRPSFTSRTRRLCVIVMCALAGLAAAARGASDVRTRAVDAIKRAARYYRREVATRGGYVYYYSVDLSTRLGEGVASRDQIWVQPPGTPTVGRAFLCAYDATGDTYCLDAATDAAVALTYGQLESGGWTNCIDFDPAGARVARYRDGPKRGKNNSTLDDGISQAAIALLASVDRAHSFEHGRIHASARTALDALLAAQFPNGAFPQVWTGPVSRRPIVKACYPTYDWRTEGRIKEYWDMYTLNDRVAGTVAETLITAHQVYGEERFLRALKRLGDFLVLAQMPDPQPAWAQQYSYEMRPIWARKFEPPAIASHESQDVIEALLVIHAYTKDRAYLAPIPRALSYLKSSRLADGRLARYYEMQTNRPLYMSRRGKTYTLTYDDSALPSHYGWKIASRVEEIQKRYDAARRGWPGTRKPTAAALKAEAARVVAELDDRGRWISTYAGEALVGQPKFRTGERYISSAVFAHNLATLAAFVSGTK